MDTQALSQKTVKIISQKIEMDWNHPYKNLSTKKSIGSGFFIDLKGHLITCSHVIENSKKIFIEVPFEGDTKFEVEVVGLCPDFDIALLKTKKYQNQEYYELHNRKEVYLMKPGEEVYAVGFPLGQDNLKFTKGIISGRQDSLIQTDTPINPGNSGGPLLLNNKVIGINTSIILNTNNIGYATPISFFYLIQKELMGKDKVIARPVLGLTFQNSNQALLDINRCSCQGGILVKEVLRGSPISRTGIKKGDIICEVNGIPVDNYGLFDFTWFNEKMRLGDILKTVKQGEKIELKYWRKNKLHRKNFSFNLFPLKIEKKYPLYEDDKIDFEIIGGMIVMELTDNHLEIIMEEIEDDFSNHKILRRRYSNLIKYMNLENKKTPRLLITHIFPNSYLKNFEILSQYDIIETINGRKCQTLADFRKYILLNKKMGSDKFLEIKTEINNSIVLNIPELLAEEKIFSETYKYNISPLYYELMRLGRKKNSIKKSSVGQKKSRKKNKKK